MSLRELMVYIQKRVALEKDRVGWQRSLTPQLRDLRSSNGEFFFLTMQRKQEIIPKPGVRKSSGRISGAKPSNGETDKAPRPSTDLIVVDVEGKSFVLKDVYINYSGGFGPSPKKDGIAVKRGSQESTLEWAELKKLIITSSKTEDGGWTHRLSAELVNGSVENDLEMARTWAMSPFYQASAILHGTTNLGETRVKFSEIKSLEPSD